MKRAEPGLHERSGSVKLAIAMSLLKLPGGEARAALDGAHGSIRQLIKERIK